MDVLSSRVLLHPTDRERSRAFYRDTLGLAIYREFGSEPDRGTVFFLGAGSWSCRAALPRRQHRAWGCGCRCASWPRCDGSSPGVACRSCGEPRREPWGLLELWIADPDGVRICIVEVPEEHPLRRRG
jgi:catechol 2,3-dioxygenase-like lactoylglutathione lyase family enzyme